MANVKISELTPAGVLTGNEAIPVVQNGSTRRATAQEIADLGGLSGGGTVDTGTFLIDGTPVELGAELVTNGDFATDATGWTLSAAAWSAGAVTAAYTGTEAMSVSQTLTNSAGLHSITFTVSGVVGAGVNAFIDNDNLNKTYATDGTYTEVVWLSENTNITFTDADDTENNGYGTTGSTWTIDDVSVKPVTVEGATFSVTDADGKPLINTGDALFNTSLGRYALGANTTGEGNVALGVSALGGNTTGGDNVAVGWYALGGNTTGGDNVAVGWWALSNNTTGSDNIAVGANVLGNNTTGVNNVALGVDALVVNTEGSGNVAVGDNALGGNTTGKGNVALGVDTNVAAADTNYAIAIGASASAASNQAVIGVPYNSGATPPTGIIETVLQGAVLLSEMTAPAAPASDKAVLYVEDNGSGKTRLMVRFPTGSAVQLAIEP